MIVVALIAAGALGQDVDNAELTPEQQAIMARADDIISEGNAAYAAGNYAAAIELYGRVAAVDPWHLHAGKRQILALVRATLARGDRGKAYDAAVNAFDLLRDAELPEDLANEVAAVEYILETLPEEVEILAVAPSDDGEPQATDEPEFDSGTGPSAGTTAGVAAAQAQEPPTDLQQPAAGADGPPAPEPDTEEIEQQQIQPTPTPTPIPPTPTPAPTAVPTPTPTPTPEGPVEDVVQTQQQTVPPKLKRHYPPNYPRRAWSMRVEGDVHMQLLVDAEGRVEDVRITEVTREGVGFEQAVTEAVRKWRFEPATHEGRAVRAWIPIRIPFRVPER